MPLFKFTLPSIHLDPKADDDGGAADGHDDDDGGAGGDGHDDDDDLAKRRFGVVASVGRVWRGRTGGAEETEQRDVTRIWSEVAACQRSFHRHGWS